MPTLINIPISGPDCDFGGAVPVDVDSADSLASQPASNNLVILSLKKRVMTKC
jgi:hypothetical protein